MNTTAVTVWAACCHLPNGDHYIICPVCDGGSTQSRCMWIALSSASDGTANSAFNQAIRWHCHRAGCGVSGGYGDWSYEDRSQAATDAGECVVIPGRPLTQEHADILARRWRITPQLAAGLRTYDRGRVLFPIRDLGGIERGAVLRDITGTARLKALTRKPATYTLGSWHRRFAESSVWIVEDAVSALRASPYVNVVALLGTHVPAALMKVLRSWGRVNVALDTDAFQRSCVVADSLKVWTAAQPVPIKKDFKDMDEDELGEVLCWKE